MTTQEITKAPATADDAPESTRNVRTFVPNVDIVEKGEELLVVLSDPFTEREGLEAYTQPAPPDFGPYVTFCGT